MFTPGGELALHPKHLLIMIMVDNGSEYATVIAFRSIRVGSFMLPSCPPRSNFGYWNTTDWQERKDSDCFAINYDSSKAIKNSSIMMQVI